MYGIKVCNKVQEKKVINKPNKGANWPLVWNKESCKESNKIGK